MPGGRSACHPFCLDARPAPCAAKYTRRGAGIGGGPGAKWLPGGRGGPSRSFQRFKVSRRRRNTPDAAASKPCQRCHSRGGGRRIKAPRAAPHPPHFFPSLTGKHLQKGNIARDPKTHAMLRNSQGGAGAALSILKAAPPPNRNRPCGVSAEANSCANQVAGRGLPDSRGEKTNSAGRCRGSSIHKVGRGAAPLHRGQ